MKANEVCFFDPICSHSVPDCVAVIIFCIFIEVTTVTVLAILWAHLNHGVHEKSFGRISPLIDLDESAVVEFEVQHFEVLAHLSVRLQNLPRAVVRGLEAISIECAWERSKNTFSIVGNSSGRNPQNMITHGSTADRNLLCYGQAASDFCWLVSSLDFQLVGFDNPEFTCCVEIVVVAIKTFTVRIAVDNASLLWQYHCVAADPLTAAIDGCGTCLQFASHCACKASASQLAACAHIVSCHHSHLLEVVCWALKSVARLLLAAQLFGVTSDELGIRPCAVARVTSTLKIPASLVAARHKVLTQHNASGRFGHVV